MKHRSVATAALALALNLACDTPPQTKTEKPKQYPLRGVVVRLDPNTNLASIRMQKTIVAVVNVTSEGFRLSNVKEGEEKK